MYVVVVILTVLSMLFSPVADVQSPVADTSSAPVAACIGDHHADSTALQQILTKILNNDMQNMRVWYAAGVAVMVLAKVPACGDSWVWAVFKPGYGGPGVEYRGEFYGLTTHFVPARGAAYAMKWVRAYGARRLNSVVRMMSRSATTMLQVLPVPGATVCTPRQYELWGDRWCPSHQE